MRLSTRARYGTRAMVELAVAYPERAVSVREMAERQRLSAKYLERIMASLKAAGLARGVRGANGGYILAAPPSRINLDQVVRALEGEPSIVDCIQHPEGCPMLEECPTRDVWVRLNAAVTEILESTSLQDVAESSKRKGKRRAQARP